MKKIDYSKKYGISEYQLESILTMSKESDQRLLNEREDMSPRIFTINRKDHKKTFQRLLKSFLENQILGLKMI